MDVEEITEDIRGEKCDEEDDFHSVASFDGEETSMRLGAGFEL